MATRRYVDLTLELEIDADPIAGRVRRAGAASEPFGGWLELAAALEAALRKGRDAVDVAPEAAGPAHRDDN